MVKKRKRHSKKRPRYPTDLNDRRWKALEELIPAPAVMGCPWKVSMQRVLDAVLYVTRSGCAWRLLPKDAFPPWETVYGYFRRWSRFGIWSQMHDTLRAGTAKGGPAQASDGWQPGQPERQDHGHSRSQGL